MSSVINRRQFLRGDFGGRYRPVRPPGALVETEFLNACTRCSACIDVCPEKIIKNGQGGFPELDFQQGGCSFCGECALACKEQALRPFRQNTVPWSMVADIRKSCLSLQGITCRICGDTCKANAISFKPGPGGISSPALEKTLCTGCGACVSVCPAHAIKMHESNQRKDQPCQLSTSAVC